MMRQLPRRMTWKIALGLLIFGILFILIGWHGYGERIIGAICQDGWESSSGNSGRCSRHGGVEHDKRVDTFIGRQPFSGIGVTRWPALVLGGVSSLLGVLGLGANSLVAVAPLTKTPATTHDETASMPLGDLALFAGSSLEVEVAIDPSNDGYTVEMTTPLIRGLRRVSMNALPADRGVAQLAELVANSPKRRIGSKRRKAVEAFGTRLFNSIFEGSSEKAYRDSVNFVREQNCNLRISLRVHEQFADIPWEYMFDPDRGAFLALSQETSLVRRIETSHSTRSLGQIDQLRVLSMSASPRHLAGLDVQAERSRIEDALGPAIASGHVHLEFVDGGCLDSLRQALKTAEPHVFHFAGHGAWDEERDDGVLFFEDAAGYKQPVTGRKLGVLLNGSDLRLAIFNSCNAARPSKHDRFAGIASSLVAQGVPAAIGMQFNFDDRAAVAFGGTLLAELGSGTAVDTALTNARLAVFTIPNDLDWGTPVLTTRVALDDVIPRSRT